MSIVKRSTRPVPSEQEILICVDKGLESVGSKQRNLVYWYLERLANISKFEIVDKPLAFVQGLRSIFRASSVGVETAILHQINTRFDLACSNRIDLVAAIFLARSKALA